VKTASAELLAHLAGEVTSYTMCWILSRADSTVMRFTSHDQDIEISGIDATVDGIYQAALGMNPTAIESNATLGVDNLDVVGILDSPTITEADLAAGKYDYAEVRIFLVNYADTSQGILKLRRGWLGEVTVHRGQFSAELRGMAQQLQQSIGEVYSHTCRADLGDSRCKFDMSTHTVTGTVTAVTDSRTFADSARPALDDHFQYGLVTWDSGNNLGLSMEVKSFKNPGQFVLFEAMPYAIQVGDAYTAKAGCDKAFATCKNKFNNTINFRGEPHVPGFDEMMKYGTGGN
jgi:uncharacterized phage protein (TIGR02218 family)